MYCRAPLVLLDDCFNGMDHDTQLVIASRLLGPDGLLRRMQCTTVLTASSGMPLNTPSIVPSCINMTKSL